MDGQALYDAVEQRYPGELPELHANDLFEQIALV